ncbi:MAG: hypothetical protein BEN18_06570 [Epulopiscium sp. Nuni2H_MBin001]|nr:MAG: hypothetical protein BEN18_06570 [Epulopiscium sp. Nuni2H_MBin001]
MKIKLVDSKLLLLGAIFAVVVWYMTITSIDLIDDNTAYFVSSMQADDTINKLYNNLTLLYDTAEAIASDKDIVECLQQINTDGTSDEMISTLWDNMHNFTHITTNLSFINNISIVSIPGELVVDSISGLGTNYNIYERGWYDESLLYADSAVLGTPYSNIFTDKITASIIKFINDPVTNEPIGTVLLSIYLEDFLEFMQSSYRIANTDMYVHYNNNVSYIYDGHFISDVSYDLDYDAIYKDANYNIIEYDTSFHQDFGIVMAIDLDSIKANDYVANNSSNVISQILVLTFGITLLIVIMLIFILQPVFGAISSLIHIIDELGEDYPEYNTGISRVAEMAKFIEKSLPKKIKYLIYYDELTGLPNRKMFKTLYRTFSNKGNPFVIMLLDVKNFKGINDACGDYIGDKVLIDIANLLNEAMDGTDGTAVRYSGNEFLIIAELSQIANDIGRFYEQIILPKFAQPLQYTKPIKIDFNAAAIANPTQCGIEDDMITKIYVMIRRCKELNTSQLLIFDNDIYSVYINEERIKETLKWAIDSEEFVLNYQPIIDKDKQIVKAEALIRWFSKDLGFVPPNQFIYIAEQSRLIIDLSNWIIERVAKDLRQLLDMGTRLQISINISPIHIMEDDFVDNVKAILDKYSIDYNLICLEITEGILIEDRDIVKQNIKQLQNLGIRFALDDFGTGYSSFSYLKEYSLDIIKIDKIFVDDTTIKEIAIIDGINRISTALGMEMILEGIETQHQFDSLNQFGLIQGYYFSKPITWNELIKMLTM